MRIAHVAGMLDGMEYVDQEIAEAMRTAAARLVSEDVARAVRGFADDHDGHVSDFADLAERMEWIRQGPPPEARRTAEERRRVVESADGQDETIGALIGIEEAGLEELRRAYESGPPEEAQRVLSSHIDDEQRHVDYLLAHSPRLARLEPATTYSRR